MQLCGSTFLVCVVAACRIHICDSALLNVLRFRLPTKESDRPSALVSHEEHSITDATTTQRQPLAATTAGPTPQGPVELEKLPSHVSVAEEPTYVDVGVARDAGRSWSVDHGIGLNLGTSSEFSFSYPLSLMISLGKRAGGGAAITGHAEQGLRKGEHFNYKPGSDNDAVDLIEDLIYRVHNLAVTVPAWQRKKNLVETSNLPHVQATTSAGAMNTSSNSSSAQPDLVTPVHKATTSAGAMNTSSNSSSAQPDLVTPVHKAASSAVGALNTNSHVSAVTSDLLKPLREAAGLLTDEDVLLFDDPELASFHVMLHGNLLADVEARSQDVEAEMQRKDQKQQPWRPAAAAKVHNYRLGVGSATNTGTAASVGHGIGVNLGDAQQASLRFPVDILIDATSKNETGDAALAEWTRELDSQFLDVGNWGPVVYAAASTMRQIHRSSVPMLVEQKMNGGVIPNATQTSTGGVSAAPVRPALLEKSAATLASATADAQGRQQVAPMKADIEVGVVNNMGTAVSVGTGVGENLGSANQVHVQFPVRIHVKGGLATEDDLEAKQAESPQEFTGPWAGTKYAATRMLQELRVDLKHGLAISGKQKVMAPVADHHVRIGVGNNFGHATAVGVGVGVNDGEADMAALQFSLEVELEPSAEQETVVLKQIEKLGGGAGMRQWHRTVIAASEVVDSFCGDLVEAAKVGKLGTIPTLQPITEMQANTNSSDRWGGQNEKIVMGRETNKDRLVIVGDGQEHISMEQSTTDLAIEFLVRVHAKIEGERRMLLETRSARRFGGRGVADIAERMLIGVGKGMVRRLSRASQNTFVGNKLLLPQLAQRPLAPTPLGSPRDLQPLLVEDYPFGTCDFRPNGLVQGFGSSVQANLNVDKALDVDDVWLVSSMQVHIQARIWNHRVRAIAIGGPALEDNILVIQASQKFLTWKGKAYFEPRLEAKMGERWLEVVRTLGEEAADSPVEYVDIKLPYGGSVYVGRYWQSLGGQIKMKGTIGLQSCACGNATSAGDGGSPKLLGNIRVLHKEDSMFELRHHAL